MSARPGARLAPRWAQESLMSLVDPGRPDAPSAAVTAASRTTIVVSLVAHAIVLLAVVVVPLFA